MILVPSPVKMKREERDALDAYLKCGGKVIVYGPADIEGCESNRILPAAPKIDAPVSFFGNVPNGVKFISPMWKSDTEFPTLEENTGWKEIGHGLFYNPLRIGEGDVADTLLSLVKKHISPMPIEIIDAKGYLITFFETEDSYIVQMLAEDFETDIDHRLDEMRFHRSRVNYINHVEPIGVTNIIQLKTNSAPIVYTPFNEKPSNIMQSNGVCKIALPEKTSFLILRFAK